MGTKRAVFPLLFGFATLSPGARLLEAQSRGEVSLKGCWEAGRPLGPTGTTQSLGREAAFTTFVLQVGGRVLLPRLERQAREMWERASYWNVDGDSVTLTVFTGLNGWSAALTRVMDGGTLSGRATYLTDVIVAGAEPLRVPVTVRRIPCEPSWPSVDTVARALRPWQRGEPIFFPQQADTRAAMLQGVALPRGVVAVRELRDDEYSRLDPLEPGARVGRVVLQVVIEKDGRASVERVKVLATDGEPFTARGLAAVAALRFTPARYKGSAVHQLAMLRLEIRR